MGRGGVLRCFRLRGALLGLWLLVPLLLLLPSLSLGPALLNWLRGLHDALSQLPKNGPKGLRNLLLQGLAREWPDTRRLGSLRLQDAHRDLWPLLLLRLRDALLGPGPLFPLQLLRRLRGALRGLWQLPLLLLLHPALCRGPALLHLLRLLPHPRLRRPQS